MDDWAPRRVLDIRTFVYYTLYYIVYGRNVSFIAFAIGRTGQYKNVVSLRIFLFP